MVSAAPKTPLVSVVIPTHNRAELIARAIRSVLAQTFQDFEIIVVDDASTDATEQEVEAFGDTRIQYIRHEVNQGGASARNTGIRAAHGCYIAFQDSDDEWMPEKLSRQMEIVQPNGEPVHIVYSGFLRLGRKGEEYIPEPHVKVREGDILSQLLMGNFVSTQTLVVDRDCFENIGLFDESLPRFQDWELAIRLARAYRFRLVDEPLVLVHSTSGNITSDDQAGVEAMKTILHKHRPTFLAHPEALAHYLYVLGREECLHGSMSEGRGRLLESLKSRPWLLRAWVAIFLSFLGRKAFQIAVSIKCGVSRFLGRR